MDLPKIHSITRKLLVALLGTFLLVFLLFHMCANLMILAHDGGDAYNAFCHFMGSNLLVKIAELVLLGCFVLHIILTVWLWASNRGKRPVSYHQRSRSKTAAGSKLAIISGSLLFVCLLFHFYDFYFVKHNLVKGFYMVQMTDVLKPLLLEGDSGRDEPVLDRYFADPDCISADMKWIRGISAEDKEVISKSYPEARFEPDFYTIAHKKFSILHIVIGYLIFFFVVGLHIRHGFESAFQTFGLNNYRYARLIQVLGILYTWVVCLGFASVPLLVYFGV